MISKTVQRNNDLSYLFAFIANASIDSLRSK